LAQAAKKYIKDRVKQLEGEGYKVRVKIVKEYQEERVLKPEEL